MCGPEHNNTRIKESLDISNYMKQTEDLYKSIDYNMKNIIKNLDNTMKEPVLDDF